MTKRKKNGTSTRLQMKANIFKFLQKLFLRLKSCLAETSASVEIGACSFQSRCEVYNEVHRAKDNSRLSPSDLERFSEIQGTNTECAEQFFKWLGSFKCMCKKMSRGMLWTGTTKEKKGSSRKLG